MVWCHDVGPGHLDVLVELPAPEVIARADSLMEDYPRSPGPEVVEEGMCEADSLVVLVPGESSSDIVNLKRDSTVTVPDLVRVITLFPARKPCLTDWMSSWPSRSQ